MIRPPGGDRMKGEWAVEQQIKAMGCTVHDSRTVAFIRKGKDRYARPEYRPSLPGYVFAEIPDEAFGRAVHVQGAWGSALPIYQVENRNKLETTPYEAAMEFFAVLAEKREEAERIKRRADLVAGFDPGDPLEIISGPFKDLLVRFQRMVKTAHDMHPMIEGEMTLFGRQSPVRIDPLDVVKRS
ncbi:hypothetical protein A3721_15115 [Sulfitobacter sp. HI0023]|nr:hypothetical protein A3721_15115 [Sulfitobacter sp. HI0023]